MILASDIENEVSVVCPTEATRRRIVEHGIPLERTALVRCGLNFGTINDARHSNLRASLGIAKDAGVMITAPATARNGGHFSAFWAVAVRSLLEPGIRVIVPGCSPEVDRLRRLARAVELSEILVTPGGRFRFEQLLGISDCLLAAGECETSASEIAWAMASGVPIIAAATHSTTELLGHDLNATLLKPDRNEKRLAMRLAYLLKSRRDNPRLTETARGQAFSVLGLRRFIDQMSRLYRNVASQELPGLDIEDPALVK